MFLLPTLKPCGKYKLTAHEGSRIRKMGFTTFKSKADPEYSENCFTCLTNQGDLAIHGLPELKRQVLQTQCMKKENVIGIGTLVFTPKAEAFYLSASSELSRISLAAAHLLQATGILKIADNARHEMVLEEPKKKATAAPTKAAETEVKAKSIIAEASSVAKQNQLNEQQVAASASTSGKEPLYEIYRIFVYIFVYVLGEKSPVANGDSSNAGDKINTSGDPHNETTVSEISADLTIDSVKDHTM